MWNNRAALAGVTLETWSFSSSTWQCVATRSIRRFDHISIWSTPNAIPISAGRLTLTVSRRKGARFHVFIDYLDISPNRVSRRTARSTARLLSTARRRGDAQALLPGESLAESLQRTVGSALLSRACTCVGCRSRHGALRGRPAARSPLAIRVRRRRRFSNYDFVDVDGCGFVEHSPIGSRRIAAECFDCNSLVSFESDCATLAESRRDVHAVAT